MIYLINYFMLFVIKVLNSFGRALYFRKKIFSCQNILETNFPQKASFNFIQVGANDGISFDFLYDFVIKRNSVGIVIEPVKQYFDELSINYENFPNITPVNKAVHPYLKNVPIYRINEAAIQKYPDWVKGIASVDKNHYKRVNIEAVDIVEILVEADTFTNVVNKNYKLQTVDYIQIDTEGFDFEILKMVDFKLLKPAIIKYESVNLSQSDENDAIRSLEKNGYYVFKEGGDSFGLDLKVIKLF